MAYLQSRGRTVLFGGSGAGGIYDDTQEYAVPCDRVAVGQDGGGLPLTCVSSPRLGTSICLGFLNPVGTGALLIGPAPVRNQPYAYGLPLFCATTFVHVDPLVILNVGGNPATPCIPIPADPVLTGVGVTMQGITLDPTPCLRATDAIAVTIQAP